MFLIIFWSLGEHNRNLRLRDDENALDVPSAWLYTAGSLPRSLAAVEVLKLTFVWVNYLRSTGENDVYGSRDSESRRGYLALYPDGRGSPTSDSFRRGFTRQTALTVLAALLFAGQNYAVCFRSYFRFN